MSSVLLLHGFTSHPVLTMGPLPEMLKAAGYTLALPALPGHGTKPEDLKGVKWEDWDSVARQAYLSLPEPRAIVSLSMGGLLAVKLAAEYPAAALVALVPALGFVNKMAYLAPYIHWVMPWAEGTKSVRDAQRREQSPNYPRFPTVALAEMVELQRQIPALLPKVTAPALVMQAAHDSTIPQAEVRRYYALLGSSQKDYRVYDSEHDLLLDTQADQVATDIRDWLIKVLPPIAVL
ncbi:MAG: alpha/beta fold hydrolase [Thermaceae bacterium]|nr:alpha/beta fold hydrolase [Thermaceae bacterium]